MSKVDYQNKVLPKLETQKHRSLLTCIGQKTLRHLSKHYVLCST